MMKWFIVGLVVLVLLAAPVGASTITVGYVERVDVFSTLKFGMNDDIGNVKFLGIAPGGASLDPDVVNMTDGIYDIVAIRNFTVAPPAQSASYTPRFNESIPLPDDLKAELQEIANTSSTYYEAAVRVAWFIHSSLKYSDVEYSPELIRSKFTPEKSAALAELVWKNKKGVCRHYALLTVMSLEYIGIEAKMATGYAVIPVYSKKHPKFNWSKDVPADYKKFVWNVTNITIRDVGDVGKFADGLGVPHAWVVYRDPIAGWIEIDPTRLDEPTLPTIFDDFPIDYVEWENYTPFADMPFIVLNIHILEEKKMEVHYVIDGDNEVVYTRGAGLLVFSNGTLRYYPAGTVVKIPGDASFTFKWLVKPERVSFLKFMDNKESRSLKKNGIFYKRIFRF